MSSMTWPLTTLSLRSSSVVRLAGGDVDRLLHLLVAIAASKRTVCLPGVMSLSSSGSVPFSAPSTKTFTPFSPSVPAIFSTGLPAGCAESRGRVGHRAAGLDRDGEDLLLAGLDALVRLGGLVAGGDRP